MTMLYLTLNLYFAALLSVSALSKLDNLAGFLDTLHRQGILPETTRPFFSKAIPFIQLLVALLLVLGVLPLFATLVVLALCVCFLAIESFLLWTGRSDNCGCFGVAYRIRVDSASIVSSLILVGLATAQFWIARLPGSDDTDTARLVATLPFAAAMSFISFRIHRRLTLKSHVEFVPGAR